MKLQLILIVLCAYAVQSLHATDSVTPYSADNVPQNAIDLWKEVAQLDIYYSHDPNARARFWNHTQAERKGNTWTAKLPVREKLPLYAFANITYPLAKPAQSLGGEATNYTITSDETVHIPDVVKADQLRAEDRHIPVFEDFEENGLRDWAPTPQGGISTYKFQDPARKTPEASHALRITVNVPRERLSYRFRIGKRKFLAGVNGPQETYFANRNLKVGDGRQIILRASDFTERSKKPMADWNEISTFRFDVYDGAARASLHFTDPANLKLISRIEWVNGAE
jgi:hypothetical protein